MEEAKAALRKTNDETKKLLFEEIKHLKFDKELAEQHQKLGKDPPTPDEIAEYSKEKQNLLMEAVAKALCGGTGSFDAHQWVTDLFAETDTDANKTLSFQEFVDAAHKEQTFITHFKCCVEHISKLQDMFNALDTDHDSAISRDECKAMIMKQPEAAGEITEESKENTKKWVDEAMESMDANGDGSITFEEFVAAAVIGKWGYDTAQAVEPNNEDADEEIPRTPTVAQ